MSTRYEHKRENLFKVFPVERDAEGNKIRIKGEHFSFFVKRGSREQKVKGEKVVPLTEYNVKVYTCWVRLMFRRTFMLKNSKKFRKKYIDIPDWKAYSIASLQHYLEQAEAEKCKYMLISYKEKDMLINGLD